MRFLRIILLIFFFGVPFIFGFQNYENVKLSFLHYHLEISLGLAIIIVYIMGAISGGLIFSILKKLTLEELNS
ncbi:MAG: lipopolysaccharide assembly protein LapA domain-containing protein [Flavobacterium sp.]